MSNKLPKKPKKKQGRWMQKIDTCPYCGSKKIELLPIKHVGCVKICKECGEQIA